MSCVQKKDEAYFKTLLKIVESTPGLYYSYGTDITLKYVRLYICFFWFSFILLSTTRFTVPIFSWKLMMFTSLQRRFKLAEGWMSRPVWKQVYNFNSGVLQCERLQQINIARKFAYYNLHLCDFCIIFTGISVLLVKPKRQTGILI